MFITRNWGLSLLVGALSSTGVSARQQPPTQAANGNIVLDVMVTTKSGRPVGGLQRQDFTVLDNKKTAMLTSFAAVDGRQAPIEVVLLIDAVNTGYQSVALERQEIDKFLKADGGRLAYATRIAVLTDTGMQMEESSSKDGNQISVALDQNTVALRDIRRSAGFYGASEEIQISLQGLQQLVQRVGPDPGRKVVLWVSPGWRMLSGPEVILTDKEERQIFANIVSISTALRRERITLYSIDPLGTADIGARTFYWQAFTKGVNKPSQAQIGNLGLEVIATQSGGLALNASNDVAGQLQKCIADNGAYYEMSFDSPMSDKPNEYHNLEVRVAKPGLTARTRQGYYSQR